ncbi:hypothetical protein, partial [Motilibacter deserti]
ARAFQASVLTAWTALDTGDTTGARTTLQALRATIDSAKAAKVPAAAKTALLAAVDTALAGL